MTKLERAARDAKGAFGHQMRQAFQRKFGREIESEYNIIAMAMVTRPKDGKKFTKEQHSWMEAYEEGFYKSLELMGAV